MTNDFRVFKSGLLFFVDVGLLVFFLQEDILLQVYFLTVAPRHQPGHLIKHLISMILSWVLTFILFFAVRCVFTIRIVSQVNLISELDAAVGRVLLNPWCFRLQLHRNLAFRGDECLLDNCSVHTGYHVGWLDEGKAEAWS